MWLSVGPQILLAALLLLLPGLAVALSLRFRFFDSVALAPALSVGIIVMTSTATPFLGQNFGPMPVAVVSVALVGVGFSVVRGRQTTDPSFRGYPPGRWTPLAPFVAAVVAVVLIGRRTVQVIGTPGSISQTYDAVFHLNSVRFALDTGQASSLTVGAMTGGGFYPAGWNAVAAYVASTTGSTDVPLAVNITSIVLASVFWPLSCLLMTTWIVGRSSAPTITAGIACASLGAFPLLMMDFGVLYPNLLAISLLPTGIALAARIAGVAATKERPGLRSVLALLLTLVGLVVSHPTTFVAWLAWTFPMVGYSVYKAARQRWVERPANRRPIYLLTAGFGLYSVVVMAVWIFLRPPEEASFWGPYRTVPQALGEALFIGPMDLAPAWLVAPLALLGLWFCFWKYQSFAWAGLATLVFSAIFVVVAGFPISPLRNFFAGVWYNDSYRVAALLPVGGVLMAAFGTLWVDSVFRKSEWRMPTRYLPGRVHAKSSTKVVQMFRLAGVGALSVGAIALGQQGGVQQETAHASKQYAITNDSPLVSEDEMELMQRLPDTVPVEDIIVGNPYTGASLSYALGDRKSAQMHILSYVSPELQEIYDHLGAVATDPDVCTAVKKEKAYYVLDFGSLEVHGGNHTPPGLKLLDRNPGVHLADKQGEAKLYKITACNN